MTTFAPVASCPNEGLKPATVILVIVVVDVEEVEVANVETEVTGVVAEAELDDEDEGDVSEKAGGDVDEADGVVTTLWVEASDPDDSVVPAEVVVVTIDDRCTCEFDAIELRKSDPTPPVILIAPPGIRLKFLRFTIPTGVAPTPLRSPRGIAASLIVARYAVRLRPPTRAMIPLAEVVPS